MKYVSLIVMALIAAATLSLSLGQSRQSIFADSADTGGPIATSPAEAV